MPIYGIEVAVICDDVEEDGIAVIGILTHALGIDPEKDNVSLEKGTDESGHPVLLATLSVASEEEKSDDSSAG